MLRRLALNLLADAVRHNHPGGTATVAAGVHERLAFIEVVNTGPALDPGEVPALFEPFRRGAKQGSKGLGLGLAVVRAITLTHHGEVIAAPAPAADSRCGSTCRIGPAGSPWRRERVAGRGDSAPTQAISGSVVRPRRRWRRSSWSGRGQSGACR
ncbi:ATP-binding protein [Streptomyces sp. NPDC018352]|uniref:sensor histidine kinase n=1 Tax=Streptomyces sp. NPDC018352 TaxID=3157194 RepID=UPI0033F5767A